MSLPVEDQLQPSYCITNGQIIFGFELVAVLLVPLSQVLLYHFLPGQLRSADVGHIVGYPTLPEARCCSVLDS